MNSKQTILCQRALLCRGVPGLGGRGGSAVAGSVIHSIRKEQQWSLGNGSILMQCHWQIRKDQTMVLGRACLHHLMVYLEDGSPWIKLVGCRGRQLLALAGRAMYQPHGVLSPDGTVEVCDVETQRPQSTVTQAAKASFLMASGWRRSPSPNNGTGD